MRARLYLDDEGTDSLSLLLDSISSLGDAISQLQKVPPVAVPPGGSGRHRDTKQVARAVAWRLGVAQELLGLAADRPFTPTTTDEQPGTAAQSPAVAFQAALAMVRAASSSFRAIPLLDRYPVPMVEQLLREATNMLQVAVGGRVRAIP